jgi:hypothetical protein
MDELREMILRNMMKRELERQKGNRKAKTGKAPSSGSAFFQLFKLPARLLRGEKAG